MDRLKCSANFGRLCQSLTDHSQANPSGVPKDPSRLAERLSESLYLAHSTSRENFSDICAGGYLASAAWLAAGRGEPLASGCAEERMGTATFVFFYVSPFRYPNTACGLLFAQTLEIQHASNGVASPFDSGGLLDRFTLPDPAESPRDFLARHEMPIPQHRSYLRLSMGLSFRKAEDYVEGIEPHSPGPIGLTGGDHRRWTHEVRIPDRVEVRSEHLRAVFAPRAQVARDPGIGKLFEWCARERVDRVPFDAPSGGEFEELRTRCLDYIRRLY